MASYWQEYQLTVLHKDQAILNLILDAYKVHVYWPLQLANTAVGSQVDDG